MKFSIEIKDEKIHYSCSIGTSAESGSMDLSMDNYDIIARLLREFSRDRHGSVNDFKDAAIRKALGQIGG